MQSHKVRSLPRRKTRGAKPPSSCRPAKGHADTVSAEAGSGQPGLDFFSSKEGRFYADLLELCADDALASEAWEALLNGDLEALCRLSDRFDPGSASSAALDVKQFRIQYLVCNFWKKFQINLPSIDRVTPTLKKWDEAETACKLTNERFRSRWKGVASSYASHDVEEVLHLTRRKITGLFPRLDPKKLCSYFRFGPGADTSTVSSNTSAYDKYADRGRISQPCLMRLHEVLSGDGELLAPDVRLSLAEHSIFDDSSRQLLAPKTALIDRAIEKGPRWNVFLQLGLGEYLTELLRTRWNLDIADQTTNSDLAQRAQLSGLCTVDLSSASDCLATNVVIDLMAEVEDPYWLECILSSRTPYTLTKHKGRVRLEKIAAMGNGYTFPLETLIFYAVAYSCHTHLGLPYGDEHGVRVRAYGDDIIVDRRAYDLLVSALSYLGFSVNSKKSFKDGAFYESCGKDFFRSENVRPIFCKKIGVTPKDYLSFCNQVFSWASCSVDSFGYIDADLHRLWWKAVLRVPRASRLFGPRILGDGVINSPFSIWSQSSTCRYDTRLWAFRVSGIVETPKPMQGFNFRGHLLSKLHGGTTTRQRVSRRGDTRTQKVGTLLVPTCEESFEDFVL